MGVIFGAVNTFGELILCVFAPPELAVRLCAVVTPCGHST